MKNTLILLVLSLFVLQGCKKGITVVDGVNHSGSLHDIMTGKTEATISLKEVENVPHLYALGAVGDLKGEIQIFDGKPAVSTKTDEMVTIDNTYNSTAALLVYASVEEWQEIPVPSMVKSKGQFEIFVQQEAKKAQLDTEKPYPFMLTGNITKLNWHVVDWDGSNTDHSSQNHLKSGLNGVLSNGDVEILGFYSKTHRGIFTHYGEDTHMHFRSSDVNLAGHVDYIFLGPNMTLKLPKK